MILNAYSIYDRKALQYHPPFFASADGAAVRSMLDLVNDSNTNIGRHPGDYVLFRVGDWDDEHGKFSPHTVLVHVCDALSLVRVQPPLFSAAASE